MKPREPPVGTRGGGFAQLLAPAVGVFLAAREAAPQDWGAASVRERVPRARRRQARAPRAGSAKVAELLLERPVPEGRVPQDGHEAVGAQGLAEGGVARMRPAPGLGEEGGDGARIAGGGVADRGGVRDRLVWRVPTSSEGMPRKGASRTPALELPTMQAAFFISSEKWAKRIDGDRGSGRAAVAVEHREDRLRSRVVVGRDDDERAARGLERAEEAAAWRPSSRPRRSRGGRSRCRSPSKGMSYARRTSSSVTPEGLPRGGQARASR
jgi:hypothetical protein